MGDEMFDEAEEVTSEEESSGVSVVVSGVGLCFLSVNGEACTIQRGKPQKVSPDVLQMLKDSNEEFVEA